MWLRLRFAKAEGIHDSMRLVLDLNSVFDASRLLVFISGMLFAFRHWQGDTSDASHRFHQWLFAAIAAGWPTGTRLGLWTLAARTLLIRDLLIRMAFGILPSYAHVLCRPRFQPGRPILEQPLTSSCSSRWASPTSVWINHRRGCSADDDDDAYADDDGL